MAEHLYGEGLFADSEMDQPPVEQPKETWGAIKVQYVKYGGAHRPCDECVQLIHQKGVGSAPPAGPARRKRKGPNGDTFLCAPHAEAHKRLDDAATKAHAERVAQQQHAAGKR
jgi:hypothetical protein